MVCVYNQVEILDEVEDTDLFLLIDTVVLILRRQKSVEYVSFDSYITVYVYNQIELLFSGEKNLEREYARSNSSIFDLWFVSIHCHQQECI